MTGHVNTRQSLLSHISDEMLEKAIAAIQSGDPESTKIATSFVQTLLAPADALQIDDQGHIVPLATEQYIPIPPSAKQQMLLSDPAREILFGGAVAGGKTVGLFHAACQYVHVPGYHCIIFRSTEPNSRDLTDRLRDFLHGKAEFSSSEYRGGRFRFPSGAMIDIGYMRYDVDKYNYKGPEYHRILFDELTEFEESCYRYLFSRLRRPICQKHNKEYDPNCSYCCKAGLLSRIPLKVISTANPDGPGLKWVADRFISEEAHEDIENGKPQSRYYDPYYDRAFIPSFLDDNPGIDKKEYAENLRRTLTHNEVSALLEGSWNKTQGEIFSEAQFRWYTVDDEAIYPEDTEAALSIDDSFRLFTIDVAHTSAKRARDLAASSSYSPSWSVCAVWDYFAQPTPRLCLRYVWRKRCEYLQLKSELLTGSASLCKVWQPDLVVIEDVPGSKGLIAEVKQAGYPVRAFNPSARQFRSNAGRPGKLDRSFMFQNMLEQGMVYIPAASRGTRPPWLQKYLSELTCWKGSDREQSDQVDVSSMAALCCGYVRGYAGNGRGVRVLGAVITGQVLSEMSVPQWKW